MITHSKDLVCQHIPAELQNRSAHIHSKPVEKQRHPSTGQILLPQANQLFLVAVLSLSFVLEDIDENTTSQKKETAATKAILK